MGDEIAKIDKDLAGSVWLGPEVGPVPKGKKSRPPQLWKLDVIDAEKGVTILRPLMLNADGNGVLNCEPPKDLATHCPKSDICGQWRYQPGIRGFSEYGELPTYFLYEWPAEPGSTFRTEIVVFKAENIAIAHWFIPQDQLDKRLSELVREQQVPGRIIPEDQVPKKPDGVPSYALRERVVLGKLLPQHYELLMDRANGVINWVQPVPFMRLPDYLNPCKAPAPDADVSGRDAAKRER